VETGHGNVVTAIDLQTAVEFIWREADLLDAREYARWLRLWTAEGHYIVPIERDAADYAAVLNLIYDDAAMRDARVKRLTSRQSMAVTSAARTVRTLSRFIVAGASLDDIDVRCAQHLVEQRRDQMRLVAADITYRLVRRNGELTLDRKIIHLIDSDEALHGISYLL
jgi:3-phenylpropionate/cinnamic acid dioxygenase small subunit